MISKFIDLKKHKAKILPKLVSFFLNFNNSSASVKLKLKKKLTSIDKNILYYFTICHKNSIYLVGFKEYTLNLCNLMTARLL